jgi:hypothetical protein
MLRRQEKQIMKLRAPLVAASAAVVLGATGGFLLPAWPARTALP